MCNRLEALRREDMGGATSLGTVARCLPISVSPRRGSSPRNASRSRCRATDHFALVAARLGDREAMIRALESAFADGSRQMEFLPVEPEFNAVCRRQAFQPLSPASTHCRSNVR